MAATFTGAQFPDVQRITLSGTPNVATQIIIPATASMATVRFEGASGKLAFGGTDNAAVVADYIAVSADATHQFSLGDGVATSKGVGSFFLASASASTVVSVMVEG